LRIAINGWFSGNPDIGSGQYTDRLLEWLPRVAAQHEYVLVRPKPVQGGSLANLGKVWFEQRGFPSRAVSCEVSHVPYWGSALIPSMPTVVTVHDVIPLLFPEYASSLPARAYVRLVSASARRATSVITDSQASAHDIERLLGIRRERIHTIHLSADPRFRPAAPEEIAGLRARLELPADFVLYLGGFDIRKRVSTLVRAFASVAPDFPDVSLVIAGRLPDTDTRFAPDPRVTVREAGLVDRVRFLGRVEEADKPALYSAAMLMVFPSAYEGFGLPPLEAMACGCPVIVSNASSLPEVAGDAALVVDTSTKDALASEMVRLLGSAGARGDLSARGLAQAARFSWAETARKTAQVYEEASKGVAR
jgi:glycosyltransferase involved in cell wall biosynthesis